MCSLFLSQKKEKKPNESHSLKNIPVKDRSTSLPKIQLEDNQKNYNQTKIIIDLQKELDEDRELLELLEDKRKFINYIIKYQNSFKKR